MIVDTYHMYIREFLKYLLILHIFIEYNVIIIRPIGNTLNLRLVMMLIGSFMYVISDTETEEER